MRVSGAVCVRVLLCGSAIGLGVACDSTKPDGPTTTTSVTTTSTSSTSTSSTSTSSSSTTTSGSFSFQTTVYNAHMVSPPLSTACVSCHATLTGCRQFTAGTAYAFAVATSVAGNPSDSNFLLKNNGGCFGVGCTSCAGGVVLGHTGGSPWAASGIDPAGDPAVRNWINNGRPPEPSADPVALLSAAALELFRRPSASRESRSRGTR